MVTGLAAGAAYGLIAAGFVLVFRLTGILQLAHGDLLGAALFAGLNASPLALLVAAAGSAGLYVLLLRPSYRRRAELGWIGVTVAAVFFIDATLVAAYPKAGYVLPDLVHIDRVLDLPDGATLPLRALYVLAASGVVAVLADLLLTRTRFGLGLRAIASDPVAAALSGLRVDRLVAGAFALAGLLAAVAGLVVVPAAPLAPQTGLVLGLKGIAAALLGGLRSPRSAFAGGLAVGVFEAAVATADVPGPAWRDVAPLLLVLAYLAWRPPALAQDPPE